MSLRHIENILILLEYLLGVGIVTCEVTAHNSLTSTLFYFTFFITATLWVCTLLEEVKLVDVLTLFTIVIALTNVLINAALCRSIISFDYLKKLLMYSCTLLYLDSATKIHVKDRTIGIIASLCVLANLVMTIAYQRQYTAMHLIDGQVSAYLTFRFTNPNLTALFLSCMIMILVLRASQVRQPLAKLIYYGTAVMQLNYLAETRCRNAMLAIVIFFVIYLLMLIFNRRTARIPKWVFVISSVFPMLFASAYIMLINNPLFNEALAFMVGEGKGLSSRVLVWGNAVEGFWESPIFGAYAQVSGGTGMSQLHNTHLDVLASYGILVLALTCVLLYIYMTDAWENGSLETRTIALVGFLSTLMLGVGEAALFSGGLAIYLFMGFFLLYATQEQRLEEEPYVQRRRFHLSRSLSRGGDVQ